MAHDERRLEERMTIDLTQDPRSLPPLLEEFRAALQDEIEVAKRNSSASAVPLTNGRKIASLGNAHQYAFLIDSVLNMPDGAPGDLVVPSKAPLNATIVSVEGLRIVISVETDLGIFVPTAKLQTNLTILMRKLIERIENNANQQNPAAQRMLGITSVSGTPQRPVSKPSLNKYQLAALESALGRDLTVIWGPPGTGKTHTIGTITEHLNIDSRTVLLVSHTNTAVDQAIRHVANSMKDQLASGAVVRIGEVKDDVLRSDFPDVLMKTQVERQSRELVEEKERLSSQKQELADEITTTQKNLDIVGWLEAAKQEFSVIHEAIAARDRYKEYERRSSLELDDLRQQHSYLLQTHKLCANALRLRKLIDSKQEESSSLQGEYEALSDERKLLTARITEQDSLIIIATHIDSIRKERANLPSQNEQRATIAAISEKMRETKERLTDIQKEVASAQALLEQTLNAGALSRILKRLPKPEDQRAIVESASRRVTALDAEVLATQQAHAAATTRLAQIIEVDCELDRHADVGTYSHEIKVKTQSERKLEQVFARISELDNICFNLHREVRELENDFSEVAAKIDGDIRTVYIDVCGKLQKLKELRDTICQANQSTSEMQHNTDTLLSNLVATIQQWVDFGDAPALPEDCFTKIRAWHSRLADKYVATDLESLNNRIADLQVKIRTFESVIAEIDAKLAVIERKVINKASVLGATLTKTYLSDDIQSRKFDTVILDEASMAPIPALWVAALLAERNLIIVGDFKQLPPIVLSNNLPTKKWLGTDVFEVSGIKDKYERQEAPPHFVPLLEQRRMLPKIAEVANQFYDNQLKNAFTTPEEYHPDYESFKDWYARDWKYDNPVVLVDTGPLNAWVTSVVKHGNSSRLNFLSATVAVDIAEQLLSPDRPKRTEGAAKRILIVAPYRAHAKIVTVLLKDFDNLQDEVIAGTAHSFQGSEADVVIFDTVVDEPHFKVNFFMQSLDKELKCLLNVALTRAKFRLFILGDFDYCKKQGRKAFLGKTLIPFLLERFPRVDARDIVPEGLAARAARAQMSTMGGQIDPNCERIVVTQDAFYRLLSSDLASASRRIIIYSPFATTDRVSFLLPQLQAAVERGVEVYVITKALSERPKNVLKTYEKIENQLTEIGIAVIHKLHMHEKLVFIDEETTWSGSLNPLSFSQTQEIMERRRSKAVLKDYFQTLHLNELLAAYGKPEGRCPICGKEMIAAEGADQPYYWRCVNKCFTRGIDQPYPFNGVFTCAKCNAPVEYGYRGDYPHWRCTSNNMHRQKIYKSHLRLPLMAALVPRAERKKLCKILKIENLDEYVWGSESVSKPTPVQGTLFD